MRQRILILSHDNKIGDAIVATGLFKPLRAHWPDCEIGVLCGPSNAEIYRHHPDIQWLHVSRSRSVFTRMWASLKARFVGYDKVVYFGVDLANHSLQIVLKIVNAKQRYLFGKHPIKPLFNDVVMDTKLASLHHSARHIRFLETLNAASSDYKYDIRLATSPEKLPTSNHVLVINSQSSTSDRSLSIEWVIKFIAAVYKQYPTIQIKLLSANANHEAELNAALVRSTYSVEVVQHHVNVSHSLQVIKTADLIVSSDTYAVHAASAWNIPVVALYPHHGDTSGWSPLSDSYVQIKTKLGIAVSEISISLVVDAVNKIRNAPGTKQLIIQEHVEG